MKIRLQFPHLETNIQLRKNVCSISFALLCRSLGAKIALFVDGALYNKGHSLTTFLKEQGLIVDLFVLPTGELAKTREIKESLEDQLLKKNFGKDALFIALGGGATLDLVGFLASTYLRGVALLFLPTTLLAMVDASLGGKTALNTPYGKNLIGTFYPPKIIWMDFAFLKTLPHKEWLNGFAEILKIALIADASFWEKLEQKPIKPLPIYQLIQRAVAIKISIIEKDPFESSLRAILNFGHTIAHAIEQASHFSWSHGKAVALGCLAESYQSYLLGFLSFSEVERIKTVICSLGYDFEPLPFGIKEAMYRDKKNKNGRIHFVLLQQIGTPFCSNKKYTHQVEEQFIDSVLEWISPICLEKPLPKSNISLI